MGLVLGICDRVIVLDFDAASPTVTDAIRSNDVIAAYLGDDVVAAPGGAS
jgi:ABC-type branched-subunit amino acid transport system ATPase component